jgi:hypothetical protein
MKRGKPMTPEEFIEYYYAGFPLMLQTLELVRAKKPQGIIEFLDREYLMIRYCPGIDMDKTIVHVAYTSGHKRYLNIGFHAGTSLPDPAKLLEGKGMFIRHVKINQPEDLENPALLELLRAAFEAE